ncbi:MAG TPA: hypothetical protein VN817_08200 [Solirubrobacteraceae bacterium]|nr:hypothetical protein [Solirubrobacteraceae bacterium]
MQLRRLSAGPLVATLCALTASCALAVPGAAASTAHAKAPLLKGLTYTPLTTDGSDGFLQARYTATVDLYKAAPSITFTIDSVGTHNIEIEEGPHSSYRAGVHKVSFTGKALPEGTFKITLIAREGPPVHLVKSSDPATLLVAPAPEGSAGAGTVAKI